MKPTSEAQAAMQAGAELSIKAHRAVITRRRPSYRFIPPDISSAVNLFIQRHPDEPRPEVAHSLIKHNVILLRNSGGTVAVATPDGNFLKCVGGAEFDET